MGELEDPQGRSDVLRVDFAARGQRRGHGRRLVAKMDLFRGQSRLVDRSRQIRVHEPFLHRLDLGRPFLEREPLLTLDLAGVLERGLQRLIEPVSQFAVWNSDGFEVRDDGIFEVISTPTNAGMALVRIVVRAAVIIVEAHPTAFQLSFDPLSGDQRSAVLAGKKPSSQRHVDLCCRSTNLAVKQVLASSERPTVDQRAMLAGEIPFPPFDLPDIDAVPQHPRQCCAMKPGIARLVGVAFAGELVGQRFERVPTTGVQLERSHHSLRVLWMRSDRFVLLIRAVHVSVRREAVLPSLATTLFDPLQHLGSQIVAVILSDRRHHVERQRSRWSGSELIVDERQGHSVLIFQLLHANRVPHVAADAIELVAENCSKILAFGIGLHPRDHLVESDARRATLGRLGHFELTHDGPAALGRTFPRGPQLGINRVPFLLLARRHASPDHHVH